MTNTDGKTDIKEYNFSRIINQVGNIEICFISGSRYELSSAENRERNKQLGKALRKKGYGFTPLVGHYIEKRGTPEEHEDIESSLFVTNSKSNPKFADDMFELAQQYEQEAIVLRAADYPLGLYRSDGTLQKQFANKITIGDTSQDHSIVHNRAFKVEAKPDKLAECIYREFKKVQDNIVENKGKPMSKIRSLIEKVLKEDNLPGSYDYWRTTNPADDDEDEYEYEQWLDKQDYDEGYAVYLETSEKFGKEYASVEYYEGQADWDKVNELTRVDEPNIIMVWNTQEEAEKAKQEYLAATKEQVEPKVVKVFANPEEGIYYDDLQKVYPWEDFQDYKYGY